MFTIQEAHNAVTALSISGNYIISGGQEGVIKVWEIQKDSQKLKKTLSGHEV